jgi:hypothetical protein
MIEDKTHNVQYCAARRVWIEHLTKRNQIKSFNPEGSDDAAVLDFKDKK